MSEVLALLGALFVGYSVGVTREWMRVLRYLEANEDHADWWVTTGIAADLHHKQRGARLVEGEGES